MLIFPRGWTRRSTADGLVLFPPDGPDACHIIYRERVRPLVPVLELFRRELLAVGVSADALAQLRPRLLITHEGEYAAVASVSVSVPGPSGAEQHELGAVLLDDFYSLLHGVSRDPSRFHEHSALFVELVAHDLHHLGHRRRRYLYQPPAAWQGRPRGLETDYFPLDYPKEALMLTVMPALPRPPGANSVKYVEALLEAQRREADVADIGGPVVARTPRLPGCELSWTSRLEDRRIARRAVVLEDERYLYPVLLEGAEDVEAAREVFVAVGNSIEPIPDGPAGSPRATALNMWEV